MTRRRLSPQEKKRLAYDRDHVVLGYHSGTSFRKPWRRKEVLAEHSYRQAWRRALRTTASAADPVAAEEHPRRKQLQRSRPASLRVVVANRLARRQWSYRAKVMRRAARHEEAIRQVEAFLEGLVRVERVANPESLRDLKGFVMREGRHVVLYPRLLRAYLANHGEWLARLREWRQKVLSRSPSPKGTKGLRRRRGEL